MLQFFEYSLDLDLLTLSADNYGYCISNLALPYESNEFVAVGDLLAVEGYDAVLSLETCLLSIFAGDLCYIYACRLKSVVLRVLFRNVAYHDAYGRCSFSCLYIAAVLDEVIDDR